MAYADRQMSSTRIAALAVVALIHAILGYAIVTGLAYNVVKQVAKDLKTFDVEEPPPPEEEPPPPPKTVEPPPPIVAPPPIVRVNAPPAPVVIEQPRPVITPAAPPAPPPPPPPPKKVEPARARANLASYVSDEDYPPSAQRAGESGTTGFRLDVGTNGRVTDCTITSSSGSASLDSTTCRLMRSRARFTPARDSSGNPTTDTASGRIRWVLPDD